MIGINIRKLRKKHKLSQEQWRNIAVLKSEGFLELTEMIRNAEPKEWD